ncbi:MAG: beta-ketoacyl-[acyl-carrier-protein] synthase family protein [Gemmatimonadota bacterium]
MRGGHGERRVAVTGLGVVSAVGADVGSFGQAIVAGVSGIAPIESVDRSLLSFQHGAEVRDFDPSASIDPARLGLFDRFAQMALVAAREAVDAAGSGVTAGLGSRGGAVTGATTGGQTTEDEAFLRLYRENRSRLHPLTIPRIMPNAAASALAMEYGLTGPTFTVSTACSSSNHAIGHAFWMIRSGLLDLALAGGAESPFSYGHLKAWEAIRVVSPDVCRPFSRDRNGMILGEGAGILVLESLERATGRGAEILAEIVGFGMSADAHHITQPTVEGPAAAMRAALADGGVEAGTVTHINAHGTGTLVNDVTEARAIRDVFGPHTDRVAVSATKSMHGHALGAAGAIEAVATVLALRGRAAPPTANFTERDPECDIDVVVGEARRLDGEYALSNSFAFGGLNAVLAFRRWEGQDRGNGQTEPASARSVAQHPRRGSHRRA